jgi:HAD superfamily hydrolase (TIGR01509 family)
MFKAVIFDLDGTLVDTEAVWAEAQSRWMKSHGKTYELSFQKEMMGKPTKECVRLMAERYGLDKSPEELAQERLHFFQSAFDDMGFVEKPGACDLINALKDTGIIVAMATSSKREYAEAALNALKCHKQFDSVTCGEDVENGKPAPDIYLKAASKIGIAPEDCVVIEDAPSGIVGAKNAGAKIIGIVDSRYVEALPGADLQVSSLKDITPERLRSLFD